MLDQKTFDGIKQADLANIIRKVKAGKPLSSAERKILNESKAKEPAAAPKHGKPKAFARNQTELGELLGGVSRRSIHTWSRLEGAPKPSGDGRHDVKAWQRFMKDNGLKDTDAAVDLQALKTRILTAKAERSEFENDVRKGQFIHIDEMKRDIARHSLTAKSRLLSIPAKVSPFLVLLKDVHAVEDRLRSEIIEGLRYLHMEKYEPFLCEKCGCKAVVKFEKDKDEKEKNS